MKKLTKKKNKLWVCHLCGAVYEGEKPVICKGKVNDRKCRSNAFLKEATTKERELIMSS